MTPPRITLLTDFGTRDGFVGAMKGVIAAALPGAAVDDVAHDIPPGDIRAAAGALERYWLRYPVGTVHVVVVDPGVGTTRAALACSASDRLLVGPDNGALTPALAVAGARCVRIDVGALRRPVSPTFHGRDVFAPAACALAAGQPLESLGAPFVDPVRLGSPKPSRVGEDALGEVLALDGFGNATTNLPGTWVRPGCRVAVAGLRLPVLSAYGDVASGEPLALIDSEGRVEIAVRDRSAADRLGLVAGTAVRLLRG